MNIAYKYLRKECLDGQIDRYEYFEKLAIYNQELILKYHSMLLVEDIYDECCVKKFPVTDTYRKSLPACSSFEENNRIYIDKNGNRRKGETMDCLKCWIKTLEKRFETIDDRPPVPAFLQKKETKKSSSLLKKKPPNGLLK